MPRIVPLQLLKCLKVLLDENGGILSPGEVKRIAGLMTKYSKKLVSKCIYVQILKSTKTELLGEFMGAGGWSLVYTWINDAIRAMNWPLVQEILELLLLCPVDVHRLKINSAPRLVKGLCKDGGNERVRILAKRLVEQWLKIVTESNKATTTGYQLAASQDATKAHSKTAATESGASVGTAAPSVNGSAAAVPAVRGETSTAPTPPPPTKRANMGGAPKKTPASSGGGSGNASKAAAAQSIVLTNVRRETDPLHDPLADINDTPPAPSSYSLTPAQKKANEAGLVYKIVVKDGQQVLAKIAKPGAGTKAPANAGKAKLAEAAKGSDAKAARDGKDAQQLAEQAKDDEDESLAESRDEGTKESSESDESEVKSKDNSGKVTSQSADGGGKASDADKAKGERKERHESRDSRERNRDHKSDRTKDKDQKSSSSSSRHRSSSSSHKSSSSKSGSSSSSRSKSSSSSHRSASDKHRSEKERSSSSTGKDKDRKEGGSGSSSSSKHRSSSSSKSSSSSTSRDRSRDKDREKEKEKDKSRDKDKDKEREKAADSKDSDVEEKEAGSKAAAPGATTTTTTTTATEPTKPINPILEKLSNITKKAREEAAADAEASGGAAANKPTSITIPSKKASMSIEIRRDHEKAKTVKTYKLQFRSHGLNEEAPPPPSRKGLKKPGSAPPAAATAAGGGGATSTVTGSSPMFMASLKRSSPTRDVVASIEKKAKLDLINNVSNLVQDKPGAIKLIPPKKILVETNLFSDALSAATGPKKVTKRKRPSGSAATSPPTSPDAHKMAPLKFYQDTMADEPGSAEKADKDSDDLDKEKASDERKSDNGSVDDENTEDDDDIPLKKVKEDIEKKVQDEQAKLLASEKNGGGDSNGRDESDDDAEASPPEEKKPGPGCGPNGPPGVLMLHRRRGPKKKLSWKPIELLEEVRFFEMDENERVNVTKISFSDMKNIERFKERDAIILSRRNLATDDIMEPQIPYGKMIEMDDLPPHPDGKESKQRRLQAEREMTTLRALYFSPAMIPDSPAEPEIEPLFPHDIPIIPLEDVTGTSDNVNDYTGVGWPDPRGSPSENDCDLSGTGGLLDIQNVNEMLGGPAVMLNAVRYSNMPPPNTQQMPPMQMAMPPGGMMNGWQGPPPPMMGNPPGPMMVGAVPFNGPPNMNNGMNGPPPPPQAFMGPRGNFGPQPFMPCGPQYGPPVFNGHNNFGPMVPGPMMNGMPPPGAMKPPMMSNVPPPPTQQQQQQMQRNNRNNSGGNNGGTWRTGGSNFQEPAVGIRDPPGGGGGNWRPANSNSRGHGGHNSHSHGGGHHGGHNNNHHSSGGGSNSSNNTNNNNNNSGVCKAFMRGHCRMGKSCKYIHPRKRI